MLIYDLIVIGFGKVGKILVGKLVLVGKKVVFIECSKVMYGGICINIGCILIKILLVAVEKDLFFEEVIVIKNIIISCFNGKNYVIVVGIGVDIFDVEVYFFLNKVIEI